MRKGKTSRIREHEGENEGERERSGESKEGGRIATT